ncbi:SMP-30/gluconolactonase/LRE family protein [Lapillicoccus jejuensis]|uniref:Sugar lactone lactonase YvrE n=1 Tax=Lapillicoccus jejuensis TaxID=402171 RepID=A0A542E032_9MICO|nr:SMP-30/gluconolactonase/LRE family protein [Lapillicoccus jejuensis]TQJ08666.1 sugar lactone lactonase YvrE [Lapillicoccus jejuensis]
MPRLLLDGLVMGESPRWHAGRLWLCDWGRGEVLALDPADPTGSREVVARVDGMPFSIDWLPDGRPVATTPQGVRVGADLTPYGVPPRGFNELVVDRAGRVWVDMPGSAPWDPERLPGVVSVVLPDGTTRDVAGDVWFPNGMALLPGPVAGDPDTLLVAESHADRITAWTVTDDARLVDRRVWADLGPGSAPDGVCLDAAGSLWYASVPGRRCVRVREGGEVLQVVEADRGCFSCVLGGDDGRTLFVVANRYGADGASDGVVLTERVEVPGAAWA